MSAPTTAAHNHLFEVDVMCASPGCEVMLSAFVQAQARQIQAWRDACEATLLYLSASPWDGTTRDRWFQLTGTHEATWKILADFLRERHRHLAAVKDGEVNG